MKRQCGQPGSASGAKNVVLGVKKGRSLRISARDPQPETRAARSFHLAVLYTATSPPQPERAAAAFREAKARGIDPRVIHPADLAAYRLLDAANP